MPKSQTLQFRESQAGTYKVWRKRHRPCKGSGHLSKVRGGKRVSHCHLVKDQNPIHAKACISALSHAASPVCLAWLRLLLEACRRETSSTPESLIFYLFIYFPFACLKGSFISIPVPAAGREEKPPRNVSDKIGRAHV